MILRLSSGFSRRSSQAADLKSNIPRSVMSPILPSEKIPRSTNAVKSSKKSHGAGAKKSLFQSNTGSQSKSRASSSTRAWSAERDVPSSTASSARKRRRRSRSLEIGTPSTTSSQLRTPRAARHWINKVPGKDTRPLTDKNFQQQALAKVRKYFANYQTSDFMRLTVNSGMTLKNFVQLMNILLSQMFPHTALNQNNYLEEIPILMKKLLYPVSVNRSWLVTANTPHSWPYVLGMLHFLVCIVDTDKPPLVYQNVDRMTDSSLCQLFLEEVKQEYVKYECEGIVDNNTLPQLKKELLNRYDQDIQEERALKEDIMKMKEQLNDPEILETTKKLESYENRLKEVSLEAETIRENIKAMQTERIACEKRIQELEEETKREEQMIETLEEKITSLQGTVDNQPLSLADQEKILLEIASHHDICESLEKQKEEMENNIFQVEIESNAVRRKILAEIGRFNNELRVNCADEVLLKEMELIVDFAKDDDLFDYLSGVRPRMEELLKTLQDKEQELQLKVAEREKEENEAVVHAQEIEKELEELQSQLQEVEESDAKFKEEEEAHNAEMAKLEKVLKDLSEEKEKVLLETQTLESEINGLSSAIERKKEEMESTKKKFEAHLNEMEEYYNEVVANLKKEEEEMFARVEQHSVEYRKSLKVDVEKPDTPEEH